MPHNNPKRTPEAKAAQREAGRKARRLVRGPVAVNGYDMAKDIAHHACGLPCGWVNVGDTSRRSFEPASTKHGANFIDSAIVNADLETRRRNREWAETA